MPTKEYQIKWKQNGVNKQQSIYSAAAAGPFISEILLMGAKNVSIKVIDLTKGQSK